MVFILVFPPPFRWSTEVLLEFSLVLPVAGLTAVTVGVALGDLERDLEEERVEEADDEEELEEEYSVEEEREEEVDEFEEDADEEREEVVLVVAVPVVTELPEVTLNRLSSFFLSGTTLPIASDSPFVFDIGKSLTREIRDF